MKKHLSSVIFLAALLLVSGCKKATQLVTPPLLQNLSTSTQNVSEGEFDIMSLIPTVNNLDEPLVPSDSKLMADIVSMPLPELGWFYNRVGKSTWFYETKIDATTFSESELKQLIKIVYSELPSERAKDKDFATYALQYSLYKHLNQKEKIKPFSKLLPIALSPVFLKEAVKNSPSLISYIPRTTSYYTGLSALSVANNPVAFNYLILEDKIKDATVSKLFSAEPTLEMSQTLLKKTALEYASVDAALFLMQKDGSALDLAPDRLKQNKFVVLSALKQNQDAIKYASLEIQSVVTNKGLVGLVDYEEPTPSVVETITETLRDKSTRIVYEFNSNQDVVRDISLIHLIEKDFNRRLTDLWCIADAGDLGTVYLATFKPEGKNFLASIILKKSNNELVRYDMPAVQNPKTPLSLWFKNDNAKLNVDDFKVLKISKSGSNARIELTWTQGSTIISLRLLENGKSFKVEKTFL